MANIVSKIYKVFGVEPRCRPGCGRILNVAIAEQVAKQEACPLGHCKFKEEIEEAILFSKKPELLQFSSNKKQILVNEKITITWEILNVRKCSLNVLGSIPDFGSQEIQLIKTTNLILEFEAFNGDVYNSEPLHIDVFPSPELTSFNISHQEIIEGETSKLEWASRNIIKGSLFINGIESHIKTTDSIEIVPEIDTIVELKLIGNLGKEITRTESIKVHKPVLLKSFIIDKNKVLDSESVVISYEIENASKVLLAGNSLRSKIDLTPSNEYHLSLSSMDGQSIDRTFYLEVYNKLNILTQTNSFDIEVHPRPSILSFVTNKEEILFGEEIQINWQVQNYLEIQLQINNELIDVTDQTHYVQKPDKHTTYKLLVTSLGGLKTIESDSRKLEVFYPVEINISASQEITMPNNPVTISWIANNYTQLILEPGNIDITHLRSYDLRLNKGQTVSVRAVNKKDEKKAECFIDVIPFPKIEDTVLIKLPQVDVKLATHFVPLQINAKSPKLQLENKHSNNTLSKIKLKIPKSISTPVLFNYDFNLSKKVRRKLYEELKSLVNQGIKL